MHANRDNYFWFPVAIPSLSSSLSLCLSLFSILVVAATTVCSAKPCWFGIFTHRVYAALSAIKSNRIESAKKENKIKNKKQKSTPQAKQINGEKNLWIFLFSAILFSLNSLFHFPFWPTSKRNSSKVDSEPALERANFAHSSEGVGSEREGERVGWPVSLESRQQTYF